MSKKVLNKFLGGALALALILCGGVFKTPSVVYAENSADYINYVSFGDSIATGYGLSGYSADADFISGSYETLFKTYLTNNATDVNATSYAVDGHTATNLLNILQSNSEARQSVQNADVITVSIGGNDLLGPARANIVNCFVSGSYDDLKSQLSSALTNFETVFADILTEFSTLNANAKVIFTNVFNPYRALMLVEQTKQIDLTATIGGIPMVSTTITGTTLNEFGQMTEDYIAGNEDDGIKGMNQIMAEQIAGQENCYLVDSKTAFDSYAGEYTDVANANLTQQTSITVEASSQDDITNKVFEYLDPHPTALGHQILAREFQTSFGNDLAILTFDYNGGALNSKTDDKNIVVKDKTVSQPANNPELEHYIFAGWYTDSNGAVEYDFSKDVTTNLKLYAGWQAITFVVTYDYNGGLVGQETKATQTYIEGQVAIEPSGSAVPVLNKHRLVGWYTDLNCDTPYDFSTAVTNNITLYAKWEQIAFDVTFDYGNGTLNGEHSSTVVVDKNGLVSQPADENLPTYEDYGLVGWYKDSNFAEQWNFETDTITQDTTIYAKWERIVWYVTLDYNGGSLNGATSQVVKVTKGEKMPTPVIAGFENSYTGYVFKYWYLNTPATMFDFENTDITSDITLYAYWVYGITIYVAYGDVTLGRTVPKDALVGSLLEVAKIKEDIAKYVGKVFYGWFEDSEFTQEFADDTVLVEGKMLFVKWTTITCIDETLLSQTFSPISQSVEWYINARLDSVVEWQVNGQKVREVRMLSDLGDWWVFNPADYGVGNFTISCLVDGGVVNGKTIQLKYSVPTDLFINLDKVLDKKTYVLEVDNRIYYDEDKFVWYKTSDLYSDEFNEEIGRGFDLEYTFSSDCKICVKYLANENDTTGIMSNIVEVSVDNHIDTTTLIAILVAVAVIAIIIIGTVVSYRRHKESY